MAATALSTTYINNGFEEVSLPSYTEAIEQLFHINKRPPPSYDEATKLREPSISTITSSAKSKETSCSSTVQKQVEILRTSSTNNVRGTDGGVWSTSASAAAGVERLASQASELFNAQGHQAVRLTVEFLDTTGGSSASNGPPVADSHLVDLVAAELAANEMYRPPSNNHTNRQSSFIAKPIERLRLFYSTHNTCRRICDALAVGLCACIVFIILIVVINYILSKQTNETESLLTVSRQKELRRLVTNHLLSNGETFNEMFHFLSLLDDNCSSLLIPEAEALLNSPYFKAKSQEMQNKLATAGLVNEGFSGQVPGQVVFYVLLARQPWVRQVCEIGFNAGHSALYWLAANNRTNLLSFDLGFHDYAKVMADYMTSAYPGRFQIVWGDSTKTVPQFVNHLQNSGKMLSCDVIVVDGGHTYEVAIADLRNMRPFARTSRHLLLLDDTPCVASHCEGPARSWREMRTVIKPLFGCMNYPDFGRGFSIGYYVL